jgi:hypothetical protein
MCLIYFMHILILEIFCVVAKFEFTGTVGMVEKENDGFTTPPQQLHNTPLHGGGA